MMPRVVHDAQATCIRKAPSCVTPQARLQMPHAAPAVQRETLELAMRGALRELRAAGCRLDGGHTCTGADLALGFTVTGHAAPARLMRKDGLRPGHVLVLTKALGTGLVLRGGMLMRARGEWVEGVWASMAQSNGDAALVLQEAGVRACTDVTGFGLLGHALEMATASQVCATDISRLRCVLRSIALQGTRSGMRQLCTRAFGTHLRHAAGGCERA